MCEDDYPDDYWTCSEEVFQIKYVEGRELTVKERIEDIFRQVWRKILKIF